MPRLTPGELQAARKRSGNLGGRPRKPTADEARAAALERLVPKAIRVLEEHLDSGRPDAWRPATKVLEYSWGDQRAHAVPKRRVGRVEHYGSGHADDGQIHGVRHVSDRRIAANAGDGVPVAIDRIAGPTEVAGEDVAEEFAADVPRRGDAPKTATDRGSKNGRSEAATAEWSRAATRPAKSAVAAIGNVTSTTRPSASARH